MFEAAHERRRVPVADALLWLAVCAPALALGGVWPPILPLFAVAVLALALRVGLRMSEGVRVPRGAWIGLLGAGLCLLQWAPLGSGVTGVLAPGLARATEHALQGTGAGPWTRASVVPGATVFEAGRLCALVVLFVAASQMRWRHTAVAVAVAGTLVALIGLFHEAMGLDSILGIYEPRDRQAGRLLTTFVNPNHQSALLLLGIACASAVALDQQASSRIERRPDAALRASHAALFFAASVLVQVAVLILSLSRGALLTFVLLMPFVALVLWRDRDPSPDREGARRRGLALGGLAAGVLGLLFVARRQTLDELATALEPGETEVKLRVARDGLGLVRQAPILGIGRGSFVDAFPLVDTQPGSMLFTHLESTPVAMIVEWGPVGGGVILFGLTLWWLAAFRAAEGASRRLALLGLLALAIQSTVDFSLEYLGVAAPAVALAGALSPTREERWDRGRSVAIGVALCLLAAGLGWLGGPLGISGRRAANEAVARGDLPAHRALSNRPLDAQLHLRLARLAADEGDWAALAHHAEVLTWLRPSTVEGWLMRAAVARRGGSGQDADAHLRRALTSLERPPDAALVAYLTSLADPDTLARVAPIEGEAWRHLMDGLLNHAPDHVDAVARAREAHFPFDADALRYRTRAALAMERPLLALHLARLLRDSAPDRADSWRLLVRARSAVGGPDTHAEIQAELREALRGPVLLDDPATVEELLLASLSRTARSREELEAALELGERLLTREASREDLRRRERRVMEIEERLGRR